MGNLYIINGGLQKSPFSPVNKRANERRIIMKHSVAPPRYLTVAVDIAKRIRKGEFKEGQKMFGRSLLASQYEVSPETIRRSLGLLAEMEVVIVKPQSGTVVGPTENADYYVDYFEKDIEVREAYEKITDLLHQYDELNNEMMKTIDRLMDRRRSQISVDQPLPNYEIEIPDGSHMIGCSIGETKFWGSTGGTIIAIRRKGDLIVSPGPYEVFEEGDIILMVGSPSAVQKATRMAGQKQPVTMMDE